MTLGVRILYDKENFFKKYIDKLKNRLDEMEAHKKNGYWIYKKDVKKEEGVEI